MIRISVEGLSAVEQALSSLGEDMISNVMEGMEQGLARVVREAKKLCPVDTGELRGSIRAEVNKDASAVTGTVGSSKEYAVYVEMGTGDKGRESGGNGSPVKASYRTGGWFVPLKKTEMIEDTIVKESNGFWTTGQPARPYLWPAWKANREKVLASIRRAVLKGVRGGG